MIGKADCNAVSSRLGCDRDRFNRMFFQGTTLFYDEANPIWIWEIQLCDVAWSEIEEGWEKNKNKELMSKDIIIKTEISERWVEK